MSDKWRQGWAIEHTLRALAVLMAPRDADMKQFNEYMAVCEWGLALGELAGLVHGE